jgi:serine phosphatase RsbU (regulator of sigma subunit)
MGSPPWSSATSPVTTCRLPPRWDSCATCCANAGHPPPLLVSAEGTARYLAEPSGILLAFGESRHTDGTVALPPLSTLLLYTDGLVESRHRDIDHGLDRLLATAVVAAGWPPVRFCDHILSELAGDANEDDVTLLAVRVPG